MLTSLFALLSVFGLGISAPADTSGRSGTAFDLQGFIDGQVAAGQQRIVIPPGVYRVAPRHQQHLTLRGLRDIEIIAENVEMICTETTRALTVSNCRNVTLRGLTIDYDPLPFTQGRIVALSENNTIHDIELLDGYPPADRVRAFKYEIFRPDTRTLRFGSYHQFRVEKAGPNRIRVIREGSYRGEQVGDLIAIGTEYSPGGQIPHAIMLTDCQNVTLEDVTLYASNCFGFFETHCTRTTYRRCRVERRPADDDFKPRQEARIRSLNADAYHSKHAVVGPQLIDCTAHFQADDCINICGDYHMVMASEGAKLRVLSKGGFNITSGDPLEIVTYHGRRLPDAKAVSAQKIERLSDEELEFLSRQQMDAGLKQGASRDIYEVVVDRPVELPRGSVIAAANRLGNGFKIIGCDFGQNRSRGILIKASDGLVSGNRIVGSWEEAIKVSPEYWWLEAGSSSTITIADNIIRDGQGMGIAVYAHAGSGGIAPAGAHHSIVITGNAITNMKDRHIWVTSTRGLLLRENTFGGEKPDIRIEKSRDVQTDSDAVFADTENISEK